MKRLWGLIAKVRIPFVRSYRWMRRCCIVCGRTIGDNAVRPGYDGRRVRCRYCSIECAAYDGALRNPKKSWVMFGVLMSPKPHYEYRE